MKLRWLWPDVMDTPAPLTREQRREVKRRAVRLAGRPELARRLHPEISRLRRPPVLRSGAMISVIAGLLPVVVGAIIVAGMWLLRDWATLQIIAVLLPGLLLLWVALSWLLHRLWRPWHRLAMHELGYPICAQCGYDLTGREDADRCPECGWKRLRRDEPPTVPWTARDRKVLRAHGYRVCDTCGGILLPKDRSCPRCGDAPVETALPHGAG